MTVTVEVWLYLWNAPKVHGVVGTLHNDDDVDDNDGDNYSDCQQHGSVM